MNNMALSKEQIDGIFKDAWTKSEYSDCLKKKVGAVLVDIVEETVLGVGFGGPKEPCERCVRKEYEWQQDGCWSIHSEMRAIFHALDSEGWTPLDLQANGPRLVMFVTHGPCDQCLKLMHYFNIPLAVYDVEYHNDYSKWEGKIKVVHRGTDGINIQRLSE